MSSVDRLESESLRGVLEAAVKVFAEKGYDGATMQDVARSSGLHKSSLYHYFRSKDELLGAVCAPTLRALLAGIERVVNEPGVTARQRIERAFDSAIEVALNHVAETNVILSQRPTTPAGVEILRQRLRYESAFADLVEADGSMTREAAVLRTRVLLGAINWVVMWFRPDRSEYSMKDVRSALRGVLSREVGISGGRVE